MSAGLSADAAPVLDQGMIRRGARRRLFFGVLVAVIGLGGGVTWAALAPLSTGAVAPGVVSADSRNKTVQHLEGGIIKEILVAEGAVVEPGQVLMRLDDTRVLATVELLNGQLNASVALEARLIAERDGHETIAFPPALVARRGEEEVEKIVNGQAALFAARRDAILTETAILRQRIAQFQEEITGLDALRVAQQGQIALLAEETETVRKLVDAGQERKPRLLALQRAAKQLEGERGQTIASIARAKQSIGEAELRISQLSVTRLHEVVDQLREVQVRIFDLRERLRAAEDTMERLAVRAPQAGTVLRMVYRTVGGVVSPGQPVLDIVPLDDRPIVEARIRPEDIDAVQLGLQAEVRLTAYNVRETPILFGRLVSISADRLTERTGEPPYYLGRVEILPESLAGAPGMRLFPGMPAEVVFVVGERTALDYLVRPLRSSVRRAFLEE